MQGWTATTRHGVTRKEVQKGLQDTENLITGNPKTVYYGTETISAFRPKLWIILPDE